MHAGEAPCRATRVDVTVNRVIDGDTIAVVTPTGRENLRILALDTEESNPGDKPKTPWGLQAKARAGELFAARSVITLEFPGCEPADICWALHRDRHGRPMAYVHIPAAGGLVDYQELMIREGYSPYFVKYGYAEQPDQHARYMAAESEAQREGIGVWNQTYVNGAEMRNYALLSVWWHLRAAIIEEFRRFRRSHPEIEILEPRVDHARLVELATSVTEAQVFIEVTRLTRTGEGKHGAVPAGAAGRPFQLFIPAIHDRAGMAIAELLSHRYISDGDQRPRRNYAYVTGLLKMHRGRPEMVVTSCEQITDWPLITAA